MALGAPALGLGAQLSAPPTKDIERFEVSLWPEYDRSDAVLVLYRFRLKMGTLLPATVSIPIPASVGEPHAVAWKNPDGGLMLAQFTRIVEGDAARIQVTMRGLEGQLEFYAGLEREGRRRSFRFVWPGGVAADGFSFEIQKPAGATSFETQPPSARSAVGGDGLTYSWVEVGTLSSSATPTVEIRYENEASTLSADTLRPPSSTSTMPVTVPASAPSETASRGLLYGAAGLFVGAGLSLLWWTSRKPRGPSGASNREPGFCSQCGTKAEPGGVYCVACGARLKP